MKTRLALVGLLCHLHLFPFAHAAPVNGQRYFEGKLLIEKSAGKTKDVQISWRENKIPFKMTKNRGQ